MFQVGRFDPKQEERDKRKAAAPLATKEKRKKKKKHDKEEAEDTHDSQKDDHADEETTLRVIAPETSGASSTDKQLNTKLAEEAFDDLDITEELIQDNVKEDGDETIDPTDEIQTALYMSKQAIHEAAAGWGLAPFLVENLKKDGYKNFFPIQSLVIPDVIAAERHAHIRARDICVAAPTGSGKTLAFVIPVLNALANRQIRRLRALVVLPSRDLGKCVSA
jgi:ATP-dependent RNA helicase DDX51/DBP6